MVGDHLRDRDRSLPVLSDATKQRNALEWRGRGYVRSRGRRDTLHRRCGRGLQLWNLAAVAVLFGELLNSAAADLELVSDQPGVEVMIDNPLTYPGDIVPVKFHFTWRLVGEITPTKSLADTTEYVEEEWAYRHPNT